jgi:hypothetical protein
MEEILSPSVEHAQEADFGAQMLGIGGDLQESGGTSAEQEIVPVFLLCSVSQDSS